MRFARLLKTVNTILLIAAIYLLFTLIQAVDRRRESDSKKIPANETAAMPQMMVLPLGFRAAGDFANAEYFPKDPNWDTVLTRVLSSDPPGLNPLISNEASASTVFSLCTMTLAERDWQHPEKFRPFLAEKWSISPDKKVFRVTLRKKVLWQSFTDPETGKFVPPREVTAHDVKFAVDVILDPDVNCAALRSYYADLHSVRVINDHELEFHWKKQYYGALSSTLELFPLPRHFYCPDGRKFEGKKFNDDHQRNRMIVGCGPYKFAGWEKSRRITLVRNKYYIGAAWNAAPPAAINIFEIIKLPSTQFQSLLAGQIGMMTLTPEQWTLRTNIPEFTSGTIRKLKYPGNGYSYIGYNHDKPCFADALTRRALTMLIDRREILNKLLFDCGTIAKGPFAPASVYSDPALAPWPYDPETAKKLLAQAGWRDNDGDGILERNGEKFTFTMLQISGSSLQMKTLPMIKNFFAAAGIDMKLQVVEWSVLLERLKSRNFEACNLGWTGSIDPDPYQIFHSSQTGESGSNFVGFKNPELDRKIIALRSEFDLDKRITICREIEKIIHNEQPYTFMFYSDALLALDSNILNVRLFPHGVQPLSFYRKAARP